MSWCLCTWGSPYSADMENPRYEYGYSVTYGVRLSYNREPQWSELRRRQKKLPYLPYLRCSYEFYQWVYTCRCTWYEERVLVRVGTTGMLA